MIKEHHSTLLRTKAVISLHKLAHDSNEKALDVLTTAFQNPSECSEVILAQYESCTLAHPVCLGSNGCFHAHGTSKPARLLVAKGCSVYLV